MRVLWFVFCAGWLAGAAPAPNKANTSLAYQHYSRGVELVARKKFDEALEKFQAAIDLNPAYVSSYIEYARTAVMLGKRRAGLEKLAAAMGVAKTKEERERVRRERDSLSDIFYTNETFQQYQNGLNYLRLDRSSSAVDALERALKTEPDNVQVLNAYARALRQEERYKEAIATYERAFALNDSNYEVRVSLAESLLGSAPARALELLQPLEAKGLDEHAVIVQAQALAQLKRNKDAIEILRVFAERQPNSAYGAFWLGKFYADEADGAWNARKYLMTFLRRTEEQATQRKDDVTWEARQLKSARAEAEQLLVRVNRSLE